ncbi:hypothetical protein RB213_000332, partial [Colletotrichum asianum]
QLYTVLFLKLVGAAPYFLASLLLAATTSSSDLASGKINFEDRPLLSSFDRQQGGIMEEKKQADDAVIRGLRSLGVDLTDDIVQKAASTFKGMMPMDRFRAEYLGDCSPEGLSVKASTDVEIATSCQETNGSVRQKAG